MNGLEAALELAATGELVLPLHTPTPDADRPCSCNKVGCPHIGKHPRTMNGKDGASTDIETIERWWAMFPEANVGHRPRIGVIVLDVDPRNGGNVQLTALMKRFGRMPTTRLVRTGSGGWHLFYGYEGETRGRLAPGIDIKTNKGYVVAPPSLHVCGDTYTLTVDAPIAPLPEYLHPYVAPPIPMYLGRSGAPGATPARIDGLVRAVNAAEDGNKNNTLHWALNRAAEHGIDLQIIVDAAYAAGYTPRSVESTHRSVVRATGGTQ